MREHIDENWDSLSQVEREELESTPALSSNEPHITYYAFATNEVGGLEQLLVTRVGGKQVSQKWTGKIYCDVEEAQADMEKLNC